MTSENGAVEDLTDGVVVVTGASSGIGLAAAIELARRGRPVAIIGRNQERLDAATQKAGAGARAKVDAYQCDFNSLAEVRTLATRLKAAYPRIGVLANNAGGNVPSRRSTVDGFEETIQSNHLAHFLLSNELRENLRGGRIINTSSMVHVQGRLDPDDLNGGSSYSAMRAYAMAKQANILFTVEATKRWPDILSTAFHPGVVRTRFGSENPLYAFFYKFAPGLRTPLRGARTLVWLSTVDRTQVTPGGYYVDEKLRRPAPRAVDPVVAQRLWDVSQEAISKA